MKRPLTGAPRTDIATLRALCYPFQSIFRSITDQKRHRNYCCRDLDQHGPHSDLLSIHACSGEYAVGLSFKISLECCTCRLSTRVHDASQAHWTGPYWSRVNVPQIHIIASPHTRPLDYRKIIFTHLHYLYSTTHCIACARIRLPLEVLVLCPNSMPLLCQ